MAELTPKDSAAGAPNFLGFSRGVDTDRSVATLFKAAGNVLTGGVKVADEIITNNLKEEVSTEVNAVRDEFNDAALGVPAKTRTEEDAEELPSDAKALLGSAERLTQARKRGKMSDTHYWAKMDAIARKVRHRYPGHKDAVDRVVSGLLGTTPANALRRSLQAEEKAALAKASSDERTINSWVSQGLLPIEVVREKEKYSFDELQLMASKRSRYKANLAIQSQELRNQSLRDDVNEEKAFDVSSTASVTIFSDVMNSVLGKEAKAQLNELLANPTRATPEAISQMRGIINQLRSTAHSEMIKFVTEQGRNGQSLAGVMGSKNLDRLNTQMDNLFSSMERSLSDKNFGVFAAKKNMVDSVLDSDRADVLSKKAIRTFAALDSVSKTAAEVFAANNGEWKSNLAKAVADTHLARMMTEEGATLNILSDDENSAMTPKDHALQRSRVFNLAASVDQPVEEKQTLVTNLFGPSADSYINRKVKASERPQVFNEMVNPRMVSSMQAIRDKGDVKSYNTFRDGANRMYRSLIVNDMRDIANIPTNRINIKLKFNATTGRLEVQDRINPNFGDQSKIGRELAFNFEKPLQDSAVAAVERFNLYTQGMAALWRLEGLDPAEEALKVFTAFGVDPEAEAEGPGVGQFVDSIGTAFKNAMVKNLKALDAITK
jgi:hypothetical protein